MGRVAHYCDLSHENKSDDTNIGREDLIILNKKHVMQGLFSSFTGILATREQCGILCGILALPTAGWNAQRTRGSSVPVLSVALSRLEHLEDSLLSRTQLGTPGKIVGRHCIVILDT